MPQNWFGDANIAGGGEILFVAGIIGQHNDVDGGELAALEHVNVDNNNWFNSVWFGVADGIACIGITNGDVEMLLFPLAMEEAGEMMRGVVCCCSGGISTGDFCCRREMCAANASNGFMSCCCCCWAASAANVVPAERAMSNGMAQHSNSVDWLLPLSSLDVVLLSEDIVLPPPPPIASNDSILAGNEMEEFLRGFIVSSSSSPSDVASPPPPPTLLFFDFLF